MTNPRVTILCATRREIQAEARMRALSRVGQYAWHLGAQVQLAVSENC